MDTTPSEQPNIPSQTIEEPTGFRARLKRFPIIWLAGGFVLLLIAVAVVFWIFFKGPTQPGQPKVSLRFDTTGMVTSGSESPLRIVYENQDRQDLTNVSMELVYPGGFRFTSSSPDSRDGVGRMFNLPDLPQAGSGSVVVKGIFSGSPQEIKEVKARLYYQLKNSTATFSTDASTSVSLQSPDLNLRINASTQLINAQRLDYTITFKNISEQELNRVQIRVAYPSGFDFISSSLPATASSTVWDIGHVAVGQEQELGIVGILTGTPGDEKQLQVDLGYLDDDNNFVLQNRQFATTRILESPLKISQTVLDLNDAMTVNEGDNLTYQIDYENRGEQGLHNLQVSQVFTGDAADLSTVKTSGGALVGNKLVWKASGQPDLALLQPGAKGQIRFTLRTKRNFSGLGIKSPQITTQAYVSSDELPDPAASGQFSVKISSSISASPSLTLVAGADPLQTGKESTYKVSLSLSASFNKITGAVWQGTLNSPPFGLVDGSISPAGSVKDVTYNPSSGTFIWRVGDIEAFSTATLQFNLKVVPSEADYGSALTAFKTVEISGKDGFTTETLRPPYVHDLQTAEVKNPF